MNRKIIILLFCLAWLYSISAASPSPIATVDPDATYETKALFYNLKKLMGKGIMFGHEDATSYGMGWRNAEWRSDVNDVCGKFPAVYGWDIWGLGTPYNIDSVPFDRMVKWIKMAYQRGGVNTVSWHLANPVTQTHAWDTSVHAVKEILPGGKYHQVYNQMLDRVADFFLNLKTENGTPIPVIFRPFHEHNGSWFWWGARFCTPEEYKALFRYTVTYLRDTKKVHNLLYAYSPDIFRKEEVYLERFPGPEYVDVLGFDNYWDFQNPATIQKGIEQLRIVVNLAERMGKVAALTEAGYNGIPDSTWWTKSLLYPIKNDSIARKISWILVWRNYNQGHFFAPYPGHKSASNFIEFEKDPYTLFESDLPPMYVIE